MNKKVQDLQKKLEEQPTSIKDVSWPTIDILAAACAIFRQKGFTSTSSYTLAEGQSWTNKEMLTYFVVPSLALNNYTLTFSITDEDRAQAATIIKYFRRLTFGVIADDLNDYMDRVFKTTQNDRVKISDFGVLASVPSVYDKEVVKRELEKEIKATVQSYIGEVGGTIYLNIYYISSRFIPKIECWAHEAITQEGNLVSFLNKIELGKKGQTQKIRAKVKNHGVNFLTKTLETQLNYVKPLDNSLEWQ